MNVISLIIISRFSHRCITDDVIRPTLLCLVESYCFETLRASPTTSSAMHDPHTSVVGSDQVVRAGVGKLFVLRATFEKTLRPGAAHSHYKVGKFTRCVKKHIFILNTVSVFHTQVRLIILMLCVIKNIYQSQKLMRLVQLSTVFLNLLQIGSKFASS